MTPGIVHVAPCVTAADVLARARARSRRPSTPIVKLPTPPVPVAKPAQPRIGRDGIKALLSDPRFPPAKPVKVLPTPPNVRAHEAWLAEAPFEADAAEEGVAKLMAKRKRVTVALLLRVTCDVLELSRDEVHSMRRGKAYVRARFIVMYLAKQLTDLSISKIGQLVGRDHTTCLHGLSRVDEWVRRGDPIIRDIEAVRARVLEITGAAP